MRVLMYKNASYKEKFIDLQEWLPLIVDPIKKDLKNEHLKKDLYFVKKFLASKNVQKVNAQELAEAYAQAIQQEEKGEEIAEFIVSRWLMKNAELYNLFESHLSQINADFTALESLAPEQAKTLADASIAHFGAISTYIFAVLNSVVFPDETFDYLKKQAKSSHQVNVDQQQVEMEKANIDHVVKSYDREIARLTDKYEKKLSGLQKKYQIDVEALKKQIAHLQRQLQQKSV